MKKSYLLEILGIIRSKKFNSKSAFFYLIFAFITLILIPVLFIFNKDGAHSYLVGEWLKKENSNLIGKEPINKISELLPYFVLVVTSVILIIANTLYYYIEFYKSTLSSSVKGAIKHYKRANLIYLFWMLITVVYVGYFIYFLITLSDIIFSVEHLKFLYSQSGLVSDYTLSDWTNLHLMQEFGSLVHYTEYYIFGVILSFLFIDGFFIEALRNKIRDFNKKESLNEEEIQEFNEEKRELEFVKNQFWFIDFIVLIGLTLTFFFNQNGLLQKMDKDAPLVFTVGVLTMHIVYSQLIFLFLNLRRLINEYVDDDE